MGQQYKDKEDASFRMTVYYTNGAKRVYYSRDWLNGKHRPDLGLKSLEDLVAKYAAWVKVAMIWDKRGGGDLLVRKCKNHNDGWIVNAPVQF